MTLQIIPKETNLAAAVGNLNSLVVPRGSQLKPDNATIAVYTNGLIRTMANSLGFDEAIPFDSIKNSPKYDALFSHFYVKKNSQALPEKSGEGTLEQAVETFELMASTRDTIIYAKSLTEKEIMAAMLIYGEGIKGDRERYNAAVKLNEKGLVKGNIAMRQINENNQLNPPVRLAFDLPTKFFAYADSLFVNRLGEF